MKRSELKQIIRESVQEVMEEFSPLGVAEAKVESFKQHLINKLSQMPKYKNNYKGMMAAVDKMIAAWQGGDKRIAEMWTAYEAKSLNETTPPNFPKALHDKLLKQYKGEEEKAYATMWKIFYEKEKGHKKVNEMWTAYEAKSLQEADAEQNAEHDEADLSNPEEAKEVELAKKIKALATDLLTMHGVEDEEGGETKAPEGEEVAAEEKPEEPKAPVAENKSKKK